MFTNSIKLSLDKEKYKYVIYNNLIYLYDNSHPVVCCCSRCSHIYTQLKLLELDNILDFTYMHLSVFSSMNGIVIQYIDICNICEYEAEHSLLISTTDYVKFIKEKLKLEFI